MNHEEIAERIAKSFSSASFKKIMYYEKAPRGYFFLLTWRYNLGTTPKIDDVKTAIEKMKKDFNTDFAKVKKFGAFSETSSSGHALTGRGLRMEYSVSSTLSIEEPERNKIIDQLEKMGFDWGNK